MDRVRHRDDEDRWRTSPHDEQNPEEPEAGEDPSDVDGSQQEREHAVSSVITHTNSVTEQDIESAPLSPLHLPPTTDSTVAFTGSDEDVSGSSSPDHEGVYESDDANEGEIVVLDPDHPLIKNLREALKKACIKRLEELDQMINEQVIANQEQQPIYEALCLKLYNTQQTLAREQALLEAQNEKRDKERRERDEVKEMLEEARNEYNRLVEENKEERAEISKLEEEGDRLDKQVFYMQMLESQLHSEALAMETSKSKAQIEIELAEQQKYQQDLHVQYLTKEIEKKKERGAELDAQILEQTEIIRRATEATAEHELEIEALVMEKKQILEQWKKVVMENKRKDELYNAQQEELRAADGELQAMEAEVRRLRRNIKLEQEKNKELVKEAKQIELNQANYSKRLEKAREEKVALQDCCNTLRRTLEETEKAKRGVTLEFEMYQTKIKALDKQIEKEKRETMELEEELLRTMRQELTDDTTAKHAYKRLTQIMTQRREKESELEAAENELAALDLEVTQLTLHCKALSQEKQELDQEVMQENQRYAAKEKELRELDAEIKRDEATKAMLEKKLEKIKASTGIEEDLSPLEIEIVSLRKQLEEADVKEKELHQMFMRQQEELVREYQKHHELSTEVLQMDARTNILRERSVRKNREAEEEARAVAELEKQLHGLRAKLNSILSKNKQGVDGEELVNSLMEDSLLNELKDVETEAMETDLQVRQLQEEIEEEKEKIVEIERQEMFWDRKIQLALETRAYVASETEQTQTIDADIHKLERKQQQIKKEQETLLKKMENIILQGLNTPKRYETEKDEKRTTDLEMQTILRKLQHEFIQKQKEKQECMEEIKQLQLNQSSLTEAIQETQTIKDELQNAIAACIKERAEMEEAEYRVDAQLMVVTSLVDLLGKAKESDWDEEEDEPDATEKEEACKFREVLQEIVQDYPQYKSVLYPIILLSEEVDLILDTTV